jgi:hypothetical protein
MVDAEVFGGETETASLEVLVASDRAAMGMQAWKDTIGTRFPIQLSDVRAMEYQILTQSEPRRKWQDISDGPIPSTSLNTTDHIRISLSPGAQIAFFNFLIPNVVLRITIVLKIIREGIHPVLNFQEAPNAEIHL